MVLLEIGRCGGGLLSSLIFGCKEASVWEMFGYQLFLYVDRCTHEMQDTPRHQVLRIK